MTRETTAQGTDYAVVRTFHNVLPLQTVEAPRFTVQAFIGGVLLLAAGLGAIVFLILLLQSHPASDARLPPPASASSPASDVEASVAGQQGAGR